MKRNNVGLALGFSLLLALLTTSERASAFCRTSSCSQGTGAVCDPPQSTDCGKPVFWPKPCVQYSLQEDASKQVPLDTVRSIFKTAFDTWMNAPCSAGGNPRILVTETEPVACDAHEYNQTQGNANIMVFRDDQWPYGGSKSTLALTTVTYNIDTGEIYDADMELNSANTTFTTTDTNVVFDLLSVVTHETGHFLGLSHSAMLSATMFPDYMEGDTSLRVLDADDIAAICTVYPPGEPVLATCDSTPRHGFSSLCAADQASEEGGCCSVAPGAPRGGALGGALSAVAALLLAARRSRRQSRCQGMTR